MLQKKSLAGTFIAIGFTMAGCGGSSTGAGSFASLSQSLANLGATNGGFSNTPEVNMTNGSASYSGVANIGFGTGAGPQDAALGALSVNVDFTNDTLSGGINNFQYFDQTAASGSMTITGGILTGNNEAGIGTGLTADASGTVGGHVLDMDMTGHFAGTGAEALYLYFNGKSDSSLGVGIAAQ